MRQLSKSQDNPIEIQVGIAANNKIYPWPVTNKKLKLWAIYTNSSTPHLSQARLIKDNYKNGGLSIYTPDPNIGKLPENLVGKVKLTFSAAELEEYELTNISQQKMMLSLAEVKSVGNIQTVHVYLPIIRTDILWDIVP